MTNYIYEYERKVVDNNYDIENQKTADEDGLVLHVCKSVESALPGKKFIMKCFDVKCQFIFEEKLTSEEQVTLEATINAYKAITEV